MDNKGIAGGDYFKSSALQTQSLSIKPSPRGEDLFTALRLLREREAVAALAVTDEVLGFCSRRSLICCFDRKPYHIFPGRHRENYLERHYSEFSIQLNQATKGIHLLHCRMSDLRLENAVNHQAQLRVLLVQYKNRQYNCLLPFVCGP